MNILKTIRKRKPKNIHDYFLYDYYCTDDKELQEYLTYIEQKINKMLNKQLDDGINQQIDEAFKNQKQNQSQNQQSYRFIQKLSQLPPLDDPYADFLDNWEEDIKFYRGIDVNIFNTIPNDVLFEIINRLITQRNHYKSTLEQERKQENKTLVKEMQETNKENEECYKLKQLLRQAYIDMINLQETGRIIYD